MKERNGFTLIEILSVIIVLVILLGLAIPMIFDVMNNTRKQAFVLSVDKYVTEVQKQYLSDSKLDVIPEAGIYVYNIKKDLPSGSSTNDQGYVIVDARNKDNIQYYVTMHDNNYQIISYNVTVNKLPEKSSREIVDYNGWDISSEYTACQKIFQGAECKNKIGRTLAP